MRFQPSVFPRQLLIWSGYSAIFASPYAVLFRPSPDTEATSATALAAAGLIYALLLASLTSLKTRLSDPADIRARALKTGLRISAALSLTGIPFLFHEQTAGFVPDLWCGLLAEWMVVIAKEMAGLHPSTELSENNSFCIGLAIGSLILLRLVGICLLSLIALYFTDRRNPRAIPATPSP